MLPPIGTTRRRLFTLLPPLLGFALLLPVLGFALLPRLWPKTPLSAQAPSSVAVYDAQHRLLRLTLASDEQYRLWVPLEKIAPNLVEGVLLYEDRWFHWHPGVNPWSLARAALATASGERRMGGSTLTMQLARRLYRVDSRSIPGKLTQMARAMQLELFHTKREILEAYLNLAPYGGNVEGVAAASLIHFGKRAGQLTLAEALALAVIPQNPARRAPQREDLIAARDRLYQAWLERHPEARGEAEAFRLPAPLRRARDLPFLAPHFVDGVLARRSPGAELRTTLDLGLQRLLERHLRAYVERNRRLGVRNAAALLVDSRDMGIKAAVGSADFFDADISGQVSALSARRSPGSTLKPFIYALALDQGLIHPLTVLKDSRQSFGGYTPENFDGRFAGPITATEALNRSRNLPAIALAARLDNPGLHGFLKAAGIARLGAESHYGLALVLGGAELSMEELVQLYALLANRGELRALRALEADAQAPGPRLLSAEASFLALDMLRQNPRPDAAPAAATGTSSTLPVAWKTGTSYGFRDAWTVGVFGPYVLAVWLGNFDNAANPVFVGVQLAAPLFFELVDSIRVARPALPPAQGTPPANLARVDVCAASGDLPNADCPQLAQTWFIPGKSPIRVSTLHRKLTIDKATGLAACPPYLPGRTREEVFEFWPSDMLALFDQAGLPRRAPPPRAANCTTGDEANAGGAAPRITSPLRGVVYTQRLSRPEEQAIALQATVDAGVARLYWFAGEKYLGTAPRGRSLAWLPPGPGHYVLRAVDDAGRADTREVAVSVAQ
ncbi:MAG: penicillin-binding protein 1C [Sulfuritalea sp.]|nr:penicillin-binding protein 1C [Sulfuritalea sp.]